MPPSASEHLDIIWILLGLAGLGLMGTGLYIFNGIKNDIQDLKSSLQSITNQLFERMTKQENSLNRLWGEHHATHEKGRAEA